MAFIAVFSVEYIDRCLSLILRLKQDILYE